MTSPNLDLDFPIEFYNETLVVQLPARLTILEAVAFKNTCHHLLQTRSSAKRITINLDQTTFIDSSGIGALVHVLKLSQKRAVDLVLFNVNPAVMTVLEMTGLDTIFTINSSQTNRTISQIIAPKANQPHLFYTHSSVRSVTKRIIDIIGAIVGLAITAVLFIPIAIIIRLDSPGPILFGQTRCGLMGRRFKIWKFRSMCQNAEAMKGQIKNQATGAIFKNNQDPRVTRVGRWMRRTSIDELPQFWNVLIGEMSLVGTRPPTPNEVEVYQIPQWQRLDVKPGMTGEWQVNGRSNIRNFEDVIKLDLRYQRNWSLWYDLKLILKTILVLFDKNSGAM